MARYDVYRNASARGTHDTPFLLDVQADLLAQLRSRVVVPLRLAAGIPRPARILQPRFRVAEVDVVMDTPAIVGAPVTALGERVGNLAAEGTTILAAVDFLLTGV
ncbi:MAG: plasmid maintenance protein CcdB [Myxococcales bacterium]|nr:plasmid maintenance protein CcdB [Myxococcales bacterium]